MAPNRWRPTSPRDHFETVQQTDRGTLVAGEMQSSDYRDLHRFPAGQLQRRGCTSSASLRPRASYRLRASTKPS